MSACRHCHERITFVRIETTGRAMPVDPYPDVDGNVYARRRGTTGELLGHVAHKDEQLPDGWRIYMPHFATCPATQAEKPSGDNPLAEPDTPPAEPPTLFDLNPTERQHP